MSCRIQSPHPSISSIRPELRSRHAEDWVAALVRPGISSYSCSIVHRPAIILQELQTCILECNVGNELLLHQWLSGEGIDRRYLQMSEDADTFVRDARRSDDRIVHDLKCDAVDEIIGHNLGDVLATGPPGRIYDTHTRSAVSAFAGSLNASLTFRRLSLASFSSEDFSSFQPISPMS